MSNKKKSSSRRKIFIWIAVIIIVIVGISILIQSKKEHNPIENGKFSKSQTAIAKRDTISIVLDEVGEIKPIKEVQVKSKISGKITDMPVEEGDYLNNGDIIAIIEPDMQQAQTLSRIKSDLKSAKINLETAMRNVKSDSILFAKKLISEDGLISAQNLFEKAKINYNSAQEQYDLIKEQGITEANLKLTSPASGTIIQKNVEEGEMVVSSESYSGGTILLILADLSKMIILAEINEIDIGKIAEGQKVDIGIDAFPDNDYKGKITHIAPMAKIGQNNIRVFEVKISIDNLTSELRPGMSANVTIQGKTKENIITVPIRAIFQDKNENNIVYKIESDTLVTPHIVKTGINDLQRVEIIEGIATGDTVSLVQKKITNSDGRPKGMRVRMH